MRRSGLKLRVTAWDLNALLTTLDAKAPLVERNLWLVRLMEWLRHAPLRREQDEEAAASRRQTLPAVRLRHLLNLLEREPQYRAALVELLARMLAEMDATLLLADFGFSSGMAFFSELGERIQRRLLPGTPETEDLAELFQLAFSQDDAPWIEALDDTTLERLAALLREARASHEAAADAWKHQTLDAISFCLTQVRATAFSAPVRTRLSDGARTLKPFHQVLPAFDELRAALEAEQPDPGRLVPALGYFRALLDACRRDANTVYEHLEEFGVSVDIVFAVRQLQARLDRAAQLLDCMLDERPAQAGRKLLMQLAESARRRRSVRALLARNYSLLAIKVVERSAETGEHYITRDRAEYVDMVRRAAGGGAVTAVTVFVKFLIMSLGLSPLFAGLAAGVNYAASFVLIQLAHFTLATKQPAMTAPALAHKLGDVASDDAVESFVDEVANLMRTQVAGIVGNVALVLPSVLVVQLLWQLAFGAPAVGEDKASYAVHSLSLLGWTPFFAACTGVLLFLSSLVAGWAENWFVLHRLGSALRWNPHVIAHIGEHRAARLSAWWQANVSGLAGNISLGLMLGLVPAIAGFVGVHFDVRHVTLASGQLGAAIGALGFELLREPAFWLAVAGIAVSGVLNVVVSFVLAFRLALRSRDIRVGERSRLYRAVRRRLWTHPVSFLWPVREPASRLAS